MCVCKIFFFIFFFLSLLFGIRIDWPTKDIDSFFYFYFCFPHIYFSHAHAAGAVNIACFFFCCNSHGAVDAERELRTSGENGSIYNRLDDERCWSYSRRRRRRMILLFGRHAHIHTGGSNQNPPRRDLLRWIVTS